MMKPDDEPLATTTNNKKSNTNSLISEAFNLNSSFASIQPMTLLPPTSNHFQPIIHSRTPSTEIKEPLKLIENSVSKSPLNPLNTNNPSSFFDQSSLTNNTLLNSFQNQQIPSFQPAINISADQSSFKNENKQTAPVGLFAPIPAKPLAPSNVTSILAHPLSTIPKSNSNSNVSGLSTLPPPSSIPPPPVPNVTGSTAGSNPYSARGSLNKKVYDNGVVSVAPPTTQLFSSTQNSTLTNTSSDLYVPAPSLNQSNLIPASFTQDSTLAASLGANLPSQISFNNDQSNNAQYSNSPFIQPSINLEDRLASSMSFNNETSANNQIQSNQQQNKPTVWNWFTQNKIVNTFVEKAKHGVESIVTTVDPQMKEYIHPANRQIYIVSSSTNTKLLNTIRESFNNAGFSKIMINAIDAQNSSQFATQIVGFPCALQSAKEKLENTIFYMQQAECIVISFQDFLAELSTDCWFELAIIMLKDKTNNVELTVYTEAIPIPNEDIAQLQQFTPNDFSLKWSGFACRLPEKNFNFNSINSTNPNPNLSYETPDTIVSQTRISHALKTLGILYKNKLLSQVK